MVNEKESEKSYAIDFVSVLLILLRAIALCTVTNRGRKMLIFNKNFRENDLMKGLQNGENFD